jgi:hypothetical protein
MDRCPTCGCHVEIGGEGLTHYYVPAPELAEVGWKDIKTNPPEQGSWFLGYSKDWIDDDFNEEGVRECCAYFGEGKGLSYQSAKWNNDMECWDKDDGTKPTHWMSIPKPPKQSLGGEKEEK